MSKSKFTTFGAFLKTVKNGTVNVTTTCYTKTKNGIVVAKDATVQAYNDTVEGYKNQK
jgi:hypothetical protein